MPVLTERPVPEHVERAVYQFWFQAIVYCSLLIHLSRYAAEFAYVIGVIRYPKFIDAVLCNPIEKIGVGFGFVIHLLSPLYIFELNNPCNHLVGIDIFTQVHPCLYLDIHWRSAATADNMVLFLTDYQLAKYRIPRFHRIEEISREP